MCVRRYIRLYGVPRHLRTFCGLFQVSHTIAGTELRTFFGLFQVSHRYSVRVLVRLSCMRVMFRQQQVHTVRRRSQRIRMAWCCATALCGDRNAAVRRRAGFSAKHDTSRGADRDFQSESYESKNLYILNLTVYIN